MAHDIRSPIVALEMIIKEVRNINEEQRLIMRNAANRVKDIANNLLTQYRLSKSGNKAIMQSHLEPELIIEHISRILSEKRTQYKSNKISFNFNFDEKMFGKFSLLNLVNFNRILSNVIDNAIDAGSNTIGIDMKNAFREKEYINIDIVDNGKGIPIEILKKINEGQQVTGKINGHGLGLLHAKNSIEIDWHGCLEVESEQGKGSSINIFLPCTKAPDWFLSEINIIQDMKVVILDDDESIHYVWKERLKAANTTQEIIDFYSPDKFFNWVDDHKLENIMFLVDYEYVGNILSGLDVIQQTGIENKSYLVTSRYEEIGLCNRAKELGVKMIPKSYAAYIPIHYVEIKPAVDLILLDNDVMITSAWKLTALSKNIKISSFNQWNDLLRAINLYKKTIPIYIDYELEDTLKGDVCAKILYELGYQNIYLTTGHSPEYFSDMPWVKKILGKETPF